MKKLIDRHLQPLADRDKAVEKRDWRTVCWALKPQQMQTGPSDNGDMGTTVFPRAVDNMG